jgi:hypothetical protein
MSLFLIRKFHNDMLGYFVSEVSSLNTILNLINERKFDEARIMRITHLVGLPQINKDWIVQETTIDESGMQRWDCWGDISIHYSDLKMVRLVEEDYIGCCNHCSVKFAPRTRPPRRMMIRLLKKTILERMKSDIYWCRSGNYQEYTKTSISISFLSHIWR